VSHQRNQPCKNFWIVALVIVFPVICFSQNVGIGNPNPTSRIDINNNSNLRPHISLLDSSSNGLGRLRFRSITNTRSIEAVGFSFSNFARDSYLDIQSDSVFIATFRGNGNMGVGVQTPTDRLHVNGNLNMNGLIRLNGNSGQAGEVLTSNGNAAPIWQPAQTNYPANGRLMIPLPTTFLPNKVDDSLNLGTPIYNTFGAGITIANNTITFNQAGLYEIEGKIMYSPGSVSYNSQSENSFASLKLNVDFGAATYDFLQIYEKVDARLNNVTSSGQNYSYELIPFHFVGQMTAGSVLTFLASITQYEGDIVFDVVSVTGGYISVLKVRD
jgi:hypothetical protein